MKNKFFPAVLLVVFLSGCTLAGGVAGPFIQPAMCFEKQRTASGTLGTAVLTPIYAVYGFFAGLIQGFQADVMIMQEITTGKSTFGEITTPDVCFD